LRRQRHFTIKAYGDFSTLAGKFGKGQDAYNDATGVNGADGMTRARATFTSLPGYQEGINGYRPERPAGGIARHSGERQHHRRHHQTCYRLRKPASTITLSALAPNLAGRLERDGGRRWRSGNAQAGAISASAASGAVRLQLGDGDGNANADAALAPYSASSEFLGRAERRCKSSQLRLRSKGK
jgi:hypothetical protein